MPERHFKHDQIKATVQMLMDIVGNGFRIGHIGDAGKHMGGNWNGPLPAMQEVVAGNLKYDMEDAKRWSVSAGPAWNVHMRAWARAARHQRLATCGVTLPCRAVHDAGAAAGMSVPWRLPLIRSSLASHPAMEQPSGAGGMARCAAALRCAAIMRCGGAALTWSVCLVCMRAGGQAGLPRA